MPEPLLPLEVTNLSFSIERKLLLDNINFEIAKPGVSVILGPNGAGKSLLVRMLHGLLTPDSGSIYWNGKKLDLGVRRTQSMVFQKPVLLRRSVAANIDFVLNRVARESSKNCRLILEEAGLYGQRQQPARLLSGGEQQRLAIARALATSPRVLLLDEPTASLDPASTLQIENWLIEVQASGVKIILVTHDIGQARRLAGDVIFMHRGRLLEHTETEEFFNQPCSAQAESYLRGELII